MECKKIVDFNLSPDSLVKFTKTNNVSQILALAKKNTDCPILKLSNEEYCYKSTGEVLPCKHIENRGQNLNTIRYSITNLRNLINNNFSGGSNELWVTLTFGDNKIYNPKDLYPIFTAFIKRLRRKFKTNSLDYIYVPEPHEKGDWHIHLLLKSNFTLYIENSLLREIWGQGFVKVNRLKDIDNIGAYVSAYLINIKEGDFTKKGARLYLYPPGHQLYRYSRGIQKPISTYMTYGQALQLINRDKLTYKQTLKIKENDFSNIIHTEFYNSKR